MYLELPYIIQISIYRAPVVRITPPPYIPCTCCKHHAPPPYIPCTCCKHHTPKICTHANDMLFENTCIYWSCYDIYFLFKCFLKCAAKRCALFSYIYKFAFTSPKQLSNIGNNIFYAFKGKIFHLKHYIFHTQM